MTDEDPSLLRKHLTQFQKETHSSKIQGLKKYVTKAFRNIIITFQTKALIQTIEHIFII